MTQNEKMNIQRRLNRHTFMGQNEFFILFLKSSAVLLYLIGAVWVWRKQTAISSYAETIALLSPIMKAGMTHAFPVYLLLGGAVLIYLLLYVTAYPSQALDFPCPFVTATAAGTPP